MESDQLPVILCCHCGAFIQSNPSNMCESCLIARWDITQNIVKDYTIDYCPKCLKFYNPPSSWISAAFESPVLLSLCVKRIRGLDKEAKIQEASFIYTEPHSRRLLILIVVRGSIPGNSLIEQKCQVAFTMNSHQCPNCTRFAAKDYWNACVQIRQRVEYKRTLYFLEQLLLHHNLHNLYSNVKNVKGGMDFYFMTRSNAVSFVEFVSKSVPNKIQTSQQLKSHDTHNNTYNYKYTFAVDVAPVCKNDIVCLPKIQAHRFGFKNQLLIVNKISDKIHLIDPQTCQTREMDAQTYFANPFMSISGERNLTEFFVMDIEDEGAWRKADLQPSSTLIDISDKCKCVGAWVTRSGQLESAVGGCEMSFVRTHLGYIIKVGDSVLGFDLRNSNINDPNFETISEDKLPDVILVKRIRSNVPKSSINKKNVSELDNEDSSIVCVSPDLSNVEFSSEPYFDVGHQVAMDAEETDLIDKT